MLRTLLVLLLVAATAPAQETLLRVYDVGSLAPTSAPPRPDEGNDQEAEFSLLGPLHRDGLTEVLYLDGDSPGLKVIAESVAELLRSLAPIEVTVTSSGKLFVRATMEQHKQVEQAMEALHNGGEPVAIEVQHLAVPAYAADAALRAMLEGPLDANARARLAALDEHKGKRGGSISAALGQWTVWRSVREVRYLPDFDAEIAQAASIPDPQTAIASEGLKAAVRPFLRQDGSVLLRVVASAGDLEEFRSFEMRSPERTENLRLRNTDYGSVEQADYTGCGLSTELVLRPQKSTALVTGYEGGRFEVLLFTLKSAPKPARASTFLVLPVGALTSSDSAHRLYWNDWGEMQFFDAGDTSRLTLTELNTELHAPLEDSGGFLSASAWLHGGSFILRAPAKRAEASRKALGALEQALIAPARVHIRLVAGSKLVGLLSAPVVAGRRAAFAGYRRRDYVGDYEVEVAQEARIAEPAHNVAYAGVFANVELFAAGPGSYRLRLDLRLAAHPEGIRVIEHGSGGVGLIQSIPTRRAETRLTLDLSARTEKTLDMGPNPFGGKERLRAVVSVRKG